MKKVRTKIIFVITGLAILIFSIFYTRYQLSINNANSLGYEIINKEISGNRMLVNIYLPKEKVSFKNIRDLTIKFVSEQNDMDFIGFDVRSDRKFDLPGPSVSDEEKKNFAQGAVCIFDTFDFTIISGRNYPELEGKKIRYWSW